ncbi:MAG: hypothetical protein K1060chlam5_00134 [Candidatus Anoxychlamydiales bacterium]|nr:hypothetical protein [Candidatus Anoxychlamydiales bacterium]
MLDSISSLIESKIVDHNLSIIDSKIIDRSYVSLAPDKPKLFLYSFIAFILVFFLSFVVFLYKTILIGFPISKNTLLSQNLKYLGIIEKDIEEMDNISKNTKNSLRNVISFMKDSKVTSLISSYSKNYSFALSKLLSFSQRKVLLIDTTKSSDISLLHMIDKSIKKTAIKKLDYFDYLYLGKKVEDCFEILYSKTFMEIINHLKEKYDNIIFYTNLDINKSEAKAFFKFSNKVIISYKNETYEDLKRIEIKNFENVGFLDYEKK